MRALGLEPNLFPLKRRVPYRLGVTRVVGRGGIEPPLSQTAGLQPAWPPWRDRPMSKPSGVDSDDDASVVVKVLVSRQVAGRVEAGSEGVEAPAVGFGTATPPWLESW